MHAFQQVDVDGRVAGFQVAGEPTSPPLLLLHGFPLDHRMWSAALAPLSPTFRTYAIDLPGFGGSTLLAETQPMTLLADWLARFIDVAELPEPLAVCGLSMGGYIALEFAARHPGRLSRLILCDTKAEPDSEEARAARLQMAESVGTKGMAPVAEMMLPKLVAPATFDETPAVTAELRQMIVDCDPLAVAAVARGMANRRDTTDVVATLQVPLLCVVGEADSLTPPEQMQTLVDRARHGRLAIIPRAGHLCPLEQPLAFAAAISEP